MGSIEIDLGSGAVWSLDLFNGAGKALEITLNDPVHGYRIHRPRSQTPAARIEPWTKQRTARNPGFSEVLGDRFGCPEVKPDGATFLAFLL